MSTPARQRRTDPHRRDRIIDACLDQIAESGVAGTSHRRVAALADVPLGSMTYHFDGMDDLLFAAFSRFSEAMSERFEARLSQATDQDGARRAVTDLVLHDVFDTPRHLVLTHELYTLAARDERYRELTSAWMGRSRRLFERYFDPRTARLLDALIEGITIHRALGTTEPDPEDVVHAVTRITNPL